jgi:hypothetical protein
MDVSATASLISAVMSAGVSDQAAVITMKRILDASRTEAGALVQMMEQAPNAQVSGHLVDLYA